MAFLTPEGEQLCQIILMSLYKCTSYGPGTVKVPKQMFQMAGNSTR